MIVVQSFCVWIVHTHHILFELCTREKKKERKKERKKEEERRTKLKFLRSVFLTVRRSNEMLKIYQEVP